MSTYVANPARPDFSRVSRKKMASHESIVPEMKLIVATSFHSKPFSHLSTMFRTSSKENDTAEHQFKSENAFFMHHWLQIRTRLIYTFCCIIMNSDLVWFGLCARAFRPQKALKSKYEPKLTNEREISFGLDFSPTPLFAWALNGSIFILTDSTAVELVLQ